MGERRTGKTQRALEAVVGSEAAAIVFVSRSYTARRVAFGRLREMLPGSRLGSSHSLVREDGRKVYFMVAGRSADEQRRGWAEYEVIEDDLD